MHPLILTEHTHTYWCAYTQKTNITIGSIINFPSQVPQHAIVYSYKEESLIKELFTQNANTQYEEFELEGYKLYQINAFPLSANNSLTVHQTGFTIDDKDSYIKKIIKNFAWLVRAKGHKDESFIQSSLISLLFRLIKKGILLKNEIPYICENIYNATEQDYNFAKYTAMQCHCALKYYVN